MTLFSLLMFGSILFLRNWLILVCPAKVICSQLAFAVCQRYLGQSSTGRANQHPYGLDDVAKYPVKECDYVEPIWLDGLSVYS
ncbi:hypothetical protein OUZ56_003556 [Daphnia magna]|uniref:Secreted protein n=1 Tax=Daphnia magna TaxID=35525 RepID=A0ABR0A937_9CRUS|nr:hypothetical protein OUZ56_003556 [Daphnia magna]